MKGIYTSNDAPSKVDSNKPNTLLNYQGNTNESGLATPIKPINSYQVSPKSSKRQYDNGDLVNILPRKSSQMISSKKMDSSTSPKVKSSARRESDISMKSIALKPKLYDNFDNVVRTISAADITRPANPEGDKKKSAYRKHKLREIPKKDLNKMPQRIVQSQLYQMELDMPQNREIDYIKAHRNE